jgi:hypothetical protein
MDTTGGLEALENKKEYFAPSRHENLIPDIPDHGRITLTRLFRLSINTINVLKEKHLE